MVDICSTSNKLRRAYGTPHSLQLVQIVLFGIGGGAGGLNRSLIYCFLRSMENVSILQEEATRRREALRLETETQLRRRRMELEQEVDAQKLKVVHAAEYEFRLALVVP